MSIPVDLAILVPSVLYRAALRGGGGREGGREGGRGREGGEREGGKR
jgi:hypothetical protein